MDTISLMQQLLPHLQTSTQQSLTTTAVGTTTSPSANNNYNTQQTHFSTPPNSSHSSGPPFGFFKISPTTAVVDANCGLPTAAEAGPSHPLMTFMSRTEAALPPEAASTSTSSSCTASMPHSQSLVQSYMAAVQAAAAFQSDAFHSAFRTPFPSSQPSPSTTSMPTSTTTTSDSFLTIALNTLVTSSDASSDSKDDCKSPFDGTGRNGLLCVVCSDSASGFHYGVFACEGCKGFFRRSIQQKINYRPCSKSQQCAIVRNNRNRCQYCRLKKCISVGMSRDAVRFGRVPKREKVKMVEEMQRATIRSLMDSMTVELEDEQSIMTTIEWGFQEFGNSLKKEINIGNLQKTCNNGNSNGINGQMQQLLKSFSAAINGGTNFDGFIPFGSSGCSVKTDAYLSLLRSVVQFSDSIKGFQFLYKEDKVKYLKNSIFQVLLLRLASLKSMDNDYIFSTQRYGMFQDNFSSSNNNGKFNSEMINDFIQRLRSLNLNEKQMALFTALIITQTDSNGCNTAAGFESTQTSLIKILQDKIWIVLQKTFFSSNAIDLTIKIQSLFSLMTDLKRINELHEIRLKTFSFIGHLPSPPINVAIPVSSMASTIPNFPSPCLPKKESVEAPLNLEAMPTLRRALESTPLHMDDSASSSTTTSSSSTITATTTTPGTRLSVCDRHPAVASLLSRPPASKQQPLTSSSISVVKNETESSNGDVEMKNSIANKNIKSELGEEDDEKPLNLCIRDNK
jgi:nuclear receptor subfamily 1 group D protein 3